MKIYIGLVILITAVFSSCTSTKTERNANSITMNVDSQDVDRFYAAVESLPENEPITGDWLYDNYLKDGSPALSTFMRIQKDSKPSSKVLNEMAVAMNELLPFLKANKESIKSQVINQTSVNRIINNMNKAFGNQYQKELSGKTAYFSIGRSRQMGGAHKDGVFFDVSMVNSPGLDTSRYPYRELLSHWPENLEFIFIHELAHVIQYNTNPEAMKRLATNPTGVTLLQLALIEGGANYLSILVAGKEAYNGFQSDVVAHLAKNGNAERLLREFLANSQVRLPPMPEPGTQPSREVEDATRIMRTWFYNPEREERKDGISDLGYGVGYLIAERYFERNATDGRAAMVSALLEAHISSESARAFTKKAGFSLP